MPRLTSLEGGLGARQTGSRRSSTKLDSASLPNQHPSHHLQPQAIAMLRTTITRALRTPAAARPFSTSIRALAAGDTGGTRAGGEKASDAFNKREHAQEEFYIRQEERKKLMALKDKLRKQREHLDELDRHIDDLTREQGGR